MSQRRTALGVAVALGVLSLLAVGLTRLGTPEAPRVVFRPADGTSVGQGFAEGGQTFLTHGMEGTTVWDAQTWRPRSQWTLLACRIFAISHDGRLGIGVHGHDTTSAPLVVVDLASGEIRHQFEAGLPAVSHAAFAADDRSIRTLLADRQGFVRELATWDLATGEVTRLPVGGPGPGLTGPQPVALAPDGTTCAMLNFVQRTLQLWDARTNQPIGGVLKAGGTPPSEFVAAAFTPDGRSLVAGRADGQLEVWDVATGRRQRTIPAHSGDIRGSTITVGHDSRTALSSGWDPRANSILSELADDLKRIVGMNRRSNGQVAVVDLATGRVLARWSAASFPRLSPDGRTVVTTEGDGTLAVHDLPPLGPELPPP